MRLQLTANQEVALLIQERDDILAERDLYRKQLSDALSDLKLRHNDSLDLKQQYNDVCSEHLDLKQQYSDVSSELADVKRELARERLKLSAGHSQGKGVPGDSAESITTDNTDVSSKLTAVSASSTEDGTEVDGRGGRSFSESQVTARTTSRTDAIADLPEPARRILENILRPRAHTPLPVVDEGQVPSLPMSETPTTLVPSSVPISSPVPTQHHIPPFVESGSMTSSVGMQAREFILKYGTDRTHRFGHFISECSAQLIDFVNKSQYETDARTMKDVINVIYEMAVKGETPRNYGTICEEMTQHIDPNIRDWETRDAEGKPIGGGQLFKKLLLRRCKVDFERWISFASRSHQVSKEIDLESVDWDEDVGSESDQSARILNLLRFLGTLFSERMVPERVMLDCIERLLTMSEAAGAHAHVCIEGMSTLLLSAGPELHNMRTRGRMDVCFERMKELAWPHSPYTKDVGINSKGFLRNLIDFRGRKWV